MAVENSPGPSDRLRRRMDALVTEAHIRWSVAGIRALGRSGLRVAALAPRRTAAGCLSRYVATRAVGPDLYSDSPGYVAAVGRVAGRHGPLVVYPGYEASIDALLAQPPQGAVLPYPGPAAMERIRDKRALADLAATVGLATPRTLGVGTAEALMESPPETPCAIKAVRRGGALNHTVVASTSSELHGILATLPESEPLLTQELIDGPLVGLSLVLARDGTVAARFQQVAGRIWPATAGGSSFATSVAADERLVERSAGLLNESGYWGLAQLQFIAGPRGPALIDVNTRFYGSLPLALAAGVNLPATWHAVTLGQKVPPPRPYRVGVTYRWLEAEATLALRGSWRILATRTQKPKAGAVWAADDPVPSAVLAVQSGVGKLRDRLPVARG